MSKPANASSLPAKGGSYIRDSSGDLRPASERNTATDAKPAKSDPAKSDKKDN